MDTDPVAPVESSSPLHRRNVFARVLPWTVVALAVIAAVAAWSLAPAPGRPAPRNFELALPPEGTGFVLSPAGQHLAFFVADQVRIIDLRRLESRNLAPASSGLRRFIFWSPDSAFVGYNTADGKVWKVPVNGGAPLVVCDIPESGSLMGATWRADQSIVFAVWRGSLYQVPASGGQPTRLVAIDPAREVDFHHPVSLPDGRLLVTTHLHPTEENQATGNTRLEVLDGQQRHVVLGAGFAPVAYVNGRYLLVHRVGVNAGLWAFEFSGSSTLRPEDGHVLAPGAQNATAAQDGTILYSLPSTAPSMRELVWVDRAGRVTAQIGSAQPELVTPALSPDGGRIAYSARVDGNRDVWIHDLQTNFDSRLTFDSGDALLPAWFPSGRRLVYTELRAAGLNRLASRDADGSGERQELAVGMAPVVSPDGRYVLYLIDERGNLHLRYSEVSTDGALGPPRPVFKTSPEPAIYSPRLAPDGRFLAYEERPHGAGAEVFMTHFPSGEGRWQISRGGGTQPVWARDTGELMFLGGAPGGPRSLMAATIRLSPEVVIAGALKLFELGEDFTGEVEVTPDGKRFVMVRGRPDSGSQAIRWVLAQNWVADLPPTR